VYLTIIYTELHPITVAKSPNYFFKKFI